MKSERLGLAMVFAALVVIAVIASMLALHTRDERRQQIRAQGASLVKLLSRMPLETLVPADARHGPLAVLASSVVDANFAYGVVVGLDNRPLAETVAPGEVMPPAPFETEPAAWNGERLIEDGQAERRYLDFFAPVLQGGELQGLVRVGYRAPDLALAYQQLPTFAWVALPIFLLAPVFYYLVRREIRPLRDASAQIQAAIEDQPLPSVELTASGEVGEFVRQFNQMVRSSQERFSQLETQRRDMLTHSKVVSYQKARIESVLQSLPQGVLVLDETGVATYANDKVGAMLGVNVSEVRGMKSAQWCEHPDLLAFLCAHEGPSPHASIGGVAEIETNSHTGQRVSATAFPLFSPAERTELLGTLVVLSDVTAENLAKQARKELIAHLSHELKTPLHVIGMYSEMLLEDEEGTPELRIEAANVIHDEVERITALINNMLSISRIELGNMNLERRRTRLNDLLEDAFATVGRDAKDKDLKLEIEIPHDTAAINVDKDLLRIAINNLLTNAIKYNRPGGTVTLGAREEEGDFVIYVRDTGIGISVEDQARIFEKFYRSEAEDARSVSGHGLGLALAREIVQIHAGELVVQSTPDVGTEFSIRLKRSPLLLKEAV